MQQHNRHTEIRLNPRSPVEQLLADREKIKTRCREQEKKLSEDFAYIRENAPRVILSGISSLLFPSKNANNKTGQTVPAGSSKVPLAAFDYIAITKMLWPVIRSMLITWSISKAKSFILGLIFEKKKKT
ncbi:MAG: hypothetical protein LBL07_17930 [Tannerella sp.]|jgi:hypothetical protein|nr:hypothetical protein [Tannerella sp.]